MMARRSIHTHVKFLAHIHALPQRYLVQLSKSQVSKYRNHFDPLGHFGYDLGHLFGEQVDTLKLLNEVALLRKQIIALLRMLACIKAFLISGKQSLKVLYNEDFITALRKAMGPVPSKTIARYLKVSAQSILAALRRRDFACGQSETGLCYKKFTVQLTAAEGAELKRFCRQADFEYWPLRSIYYRGLRQGVIRYSIQTFYKYCRIAGIRRKSKKNLRPVRGLVSAYPNQY